MNMAMIKLANICFIAVVAAGATLSTMAHGKDVLKMSIRLLELEATGTRPSQPLISLACFSQKSRGQALLEKLGTGPVETLLLLKTIHNIR